MHHPAVFTVEDANRRVPYLQVITRDIVALVGDLHERRERLSEISRLAGESPHSEEVVEMQKTMERDRLQLQAFEEELRHADVRLVDRLSGMVEIRSRMDDRLVWLNWQPGESEFMYWRAADDDRMMRRPLFESISGSGKGFPEDIQSDC